MHVDLNKPEQTDDFIYLSKQSYKYLFEQQKIIEHTFGIHQYEDWYYDQDTGTIEFSNNGVPIVLIKYEEVGSISQISNTWLWSWANPHIHEEVKKQIVEVKNFGLTNNLEPLVKPKWFADEYDGWEMTAIAAYILKAKGAYRFPLENTFSFVIYKEIKDLR